MHNHILKPSLTYGQEVQGNTEASFIFWLLETLQSNVLRVPFTFFSHTPLQPTY